MSEKSFLDLEKLHTNRSIKRRSHWQKRLKDFEWDVYFDFTGKQQISAHPDRESYKHPGNLKCSEALSNWAKSEKAKHIILLATLGILIQKYTSLIDIAILTPLYKTSEKNKSMSENVLPVRLNDFLELNFRQLLGRLKEDIIQDFRQGNYPIEEILNKSEEEIRHLPTVGMLLTDIQEIKDFDNFFPDLLFQFNLSKGLDLIIHYDHLKYNASYIAQIAKRYFYLLDQLLHNKEEKIEQIAFLSEEEKDDLLNKFNDTANDYPREETIISLFEKQVARSPDNVALICGEKKYTYQQLKENVDKIGRYLKEKKGVKPGDLVGLILEREEHLIPIIYGILKAGAAYVPIDPAFPINRIRTIIDDSEMKVLFVRESYSQTLLGHKPSIINLDKAMSEILAQTISPFEVKPESTQLAYVIYTSGTTGKPKGTMIEHHSVVNRILWMQKAYPISPSDVLLQKTPIVFDVSVWELFWWGFVGASLVLLKPGGEKDPRELIQAIDKYGISTLHFVPSMLGIFLSVLAKGFPDKSLRSIRQVFSSGEALKTEQVHLFGKYLNKRRGSRLINLYGPTEATVDVSYFECDFENIGRSIPIGKPIDNIRLHILDARGRILPIGVKGELHIAGVGLARGYLHQEALTKEKFLCDFMDGEPKVYKTGDLARRLPDGNIEFLGRLDHQVKIGGLRIELGDIENQLLKYPAIQEAVVLVSEKEEELFLVSYYVAGEAIELSSLREFLSELLPAYMIPTYFVRLDAIPLNGNGKIDRKVLPKPKITLGKNYVAPDSEMGKILVEIWAKILKIDKVLIGIHSNFFELGGSSLKVIELNALLNDRLNVDLTVAELLQFNTISAIMDFINHGNEKAEEYKDTVKKEVSGMHSGLHLLSQITKK